MQDVLVSESKVLAFCPNCGGDCEPLFQCDHRRAQTYLCESCAFLCRLREGRTTLDPMTVGELRCLMTVPGWHMIAETQAFIRKRACAIDLPPPRQEPDPAWLGEQTPVYAPGSDPPCNLKDWNRDSFEAWFYLLCAAAFVGICWACWRTWE